MNTSEKHQVNHNGHSIGGHAVVLGGSLAGLLAARVLADYFEHVTLIERETEGGSPGFMTKFMHCYMDHVLRLATESVSVRRVLLRAFNILIPPSALFHPRILFSVLVNAGKSLVARTETRKGTRSVSRRGSRWVAPHDARKRHLNSVG